MRRNSFGRFCLRQAIQRGGQAASGRGPRQRERAGRGAQAASEAPERGKLLAMANTGRQKTLAGFDGRDDSASGKPAAAAGRPEQPELAGRTVYVVDAHSLIYQLFHALPEMTSPTGQPVAAVHGLLRDLLDLLERRRPDYLFCAFDTPGPTFRHQLYAPYKIQREEMPQDLQLQLPLIRRALQALNIPVLEAPGYEADDVMAAVAEQAASQGAQVVLVTTDKDCRQLISDRVKLYNIRKDEELDAEAVRREWGVRPDQVVDFQALCGDPTDNVPGAPGIGKKTARDLLQQYGDLDTVLARAGEIKANKRRESLLAARDQVLLSRRLVQLARDAPVRVDWEAGRVGGVDAEQLASLCAELGFRRLAERVERLAVKAAPARWRVDYRIAASDAELATLAAELERQPRVAIDTETTSLWPRRADIVGYSFSWEDGRAWYVPVRAPEGEPHADPRRVLERLRPILENPRIAKVGQNVKYDMVVLRSAGVRLQGLAFDTMVADYLLDPGQRNHSLDALAKRYLNHTMINIKEVIGRGKSQLRMDQAPLAEVARYAAEDADVAWRLAGVLRRRLEEEGLASLYEELELPLIDVLAEMEYYGIRVDVERLKQLSRRYGQRLDQLQREIHELAGSPLNIDSHQQLAAVLYDRLKLPVIKRTKTGRSTDAETLGQLAKLHPLPAKIIEYRQFAKLKSTYVDALPRLVHPETGRVHTSFRQDVAATGRLSSSDPNLQNIPVRTAEGRDIRAAFLPEPGWRLLAADYSQIELRVLAHCSQDAALLEAFRQDRDIHTQVAAEIYGVAPEQVTWPMRRRAKAVNFGVIYGQTPFGLAKSLDIDKDEAARFIDAYFARYPGVEQFIRQTLDACRRRGYVSTLLGRRRPVQGVRGGSRAGAARQRSLPERIAINTVIQGSAADLIKRAMIRVRDRLRREDRRARMLLQIHDELIFEAPPEELDAVAAAVADEMARAAELAVPLKVDVKTGDNWAECEPWTPETS